jgi:hypothetical protein
MDEQDRNKAVSVGFAIQDMAGNMLWQDSQTATLGTCGMFLHKERAEQIAEKWNEHNFDTDLETDPDVYNSMIEQGVPPQDNKVSVVEVFIREVDWNKTNGKSPFHKA